MKNVLKNQKGIAFIETLIALVLLGLIGAAFMMALSVSSKAIILSDELTISESLARSQMEFIKNQGYITAADYDPGVPGSGESVYQKIAPVPDGYTIWSEDRAGTIVSDIIGVPWDSQNSQPEDPDAGLQSIKLTIRHHGNDVLTLEGYKVNR